MKCAGVKLSVVFWFLAACAHADTVVLKNGNRFEGVVLRQGVKTTVVELCAGEITFNRPEIARIIPAPAGENDEFLRSCYQESAQAAQVKDKVEADRVASIKRWMDAQELMRVEFLRKESGSTVVNVRQDAYSRHVFVPALLNEEVTVNFLVDTGSPRVLISRQCAEKLGIDVSSDISSRKYVMANGSTFSVQPIVFRSIEVEGARAENVEGDVIISGSAQDLFRDGLLGMTFLERFTFTFDTKAGTLILKKRE